VRIGIVCYPTFGGSGVVAADLAHGLAERGHQVHLLSYEPPARLASFHPNLSFHTVEVTAYPLYKYPPYTLALAARMAEVAQAHSLQLLNVHYAVPHAASALVARQLLPRGRRFALVTTCHGTDVSLAGGDAGFTPLIRWTLRNSEAVTAVSGWLAGETRRLFGVKRPAVLPNFVDVDRFIPGVPSGDETVVVHCSNLRPVKRISDVIAAFAAVVRRLLARLLVVGDGPEAPRARQEAERLGVSRRVHFYGSQTSVQEILRGATACLLASESESFGLSALEAMACGVPVVAPRVGGLPEVIQDGVTGFLAPPGDVGALGNALRRLCASPALSLKMGKAARARAERRFSRSQGIDGYEAIYRKVLDA
jgi:N-acetyl-alpha-D-glucosaminyl L-malate synthase BshA